MHSVRIRSSPRVKSGDQYRADRFVSPTPADHNVARRYPEVFRKNPGPGYRHVLKVRHVRAFLELLPEWPTLSVGLNAILLAPPRPYCDGFHRPGLVAICAQPRDLHVFVPSRAGYIDQHRDLFDRLRVQI